MRTPDQNSRPGFFAILASVLALTGCGAPPAGRAAPLTSSDHPSAAMPMQDVQTEVTVLEMENQYIAEKNSQPVRPEQAEAMKKQKEKEDQARAQVEAKKQQDAKAEVKKKPAPPKTDAPAKTP